MSEMGKRSWKKRKSKQGPEYWRKLQANGVRTRLARKKKTGSYFTV